MKTKILLGGFLALALVLGIWFGINAENNLPADDAAKNGSALNETEARTIAEQTCIKGGGALSAGIYNDGTKTWWFDANLNATRPGCDPACVVSEETKTAEINWRCTGLIPPTTIANFEECANAGNPIMESYPRQCRANGRTYVENIETPPSPPVVGGDSDIHGCKGSAGYSWCELKQKCLRTWEEPCGTIAPADPQKISCPPKTGNEEKMACIALYQPVCAEVQVQCVRAPCPPIPQTFGNSCEACNNPLVTEYTEGECAK
ncbi:MAG: hypothetical protein WC878_07985 [Candidatus Paceibacterota bacterium]|jgi:hypothetical protein